MWVFLGAYHQNILSKRLNILMRDSVRLCMLTVQKAIDKSVVSGGCVGPSPLSRKKYNFLKGIFCTQFDRSFLFLLHIPDILWHYFHFFAYSELKITRFPCHKHTNKCVRNSVRRCRCCCFWCSVFCLPLWNFKWFNIDIEIEVHIRPTVYQFAILVSII